MLKPTLLAATYLAPRNRPLYEFVAKACGASALIDGGDWRELGAGRFDIAFICSPPVIWLGGAVEPVAAPILTDARFGGKPLYCSDVIVNRDAPFQSLEDLRGARWAINEPSSWSGYWVTLQRIGSWDFFSEVVKAGFHERALRMVADGRSTAPQSTATCSPLPSANPKLLLGLHDPLLKEFGVEGFAPARDYSPIATVVGARPQ